MMERGRKKEKGKMTRGKKSNMKRGKTNKNGVQGIRNMENIIIVEKWGGFLPHPPVDCLKDKFIFHSHGVNWIDLNVCSLCPKDRLKCERRSEYLLSLKTSKNERIQAKNDNI